MSAQKRNLTGDPKIDFPEMFENEIDNIDELESDINVHVLEIEKQNEYIKKVMIDEVLENVEIKEDNSIYDKRLKRPLLKRIFEALFGNDTQR